MRIRHSGDLIIGPSAPMVSAIAKFLQRVTIGQGLNSFDASIVTHVIRPALSPNSATCPTTCCSPSTLENPGYIDVHHCNPLRGSGWIRSQPFAPNGAKS